MTNPASVSATRREETIVRLGGHGDNFHPTWAADDNQYIAVCDGYGFVDPAVAFYNSRMTRVAGDPVSGVTYGDVPGYPEITGFGRYYNFGTIVIDGTFYQFLSTPENTFGDSMETGTTFVGAKLVYSPDLGKTWYNQDGTTPVVFEDFADRSTDNMAFFQEDGGTFALPSFLQMGKDYSANTDGYVYVYSPNGPADGTMNQIVMFRVPKDKILDRGAYEYFVSRDADGTATWSTDITKRGVVHENPKGWVNTWLHPWAWLPSLAYNEGLGLYMMTNWGMGVAEDGKWFGKRSYLGIWVAEQPWGPWTQVHEDTHWAPGGDEKAECYHPVIPPKWISADGTSFWLVWTDFQVVGTDEEKAARSEAHKAATEANDVPALKALARAGQPHYSFSAQRVDLTVTP
jgi:hypothetical protein